MVRRRGAAAGVARRAEATRRATRASTQNASITRSSGNQADSDALVPGVYKQMLRESRALQNRMTSDAAERPLKRRRTGRQAAPGSSTCLDTENDGSETAGGPSGRTNNTTIIEEPDSEDDDEGIEFEDVDIPKPTVQTTYRDSSDEESESEAQFEDVDFGAVFANSEQALDKQDTLELNLTAAKEALTPSKRAAHRRKPITKDDKERRVEIHKAHLLCLLAHVEKRNHWCNDPVVQESLQPLLTAKIVQLLNPEPHLHQFGQTESLKKGLQMIMEKFQQRFTITKIGLRRALWAEDQKQLENVCAPMSGFSIVAASRRQC
jgi:xeroderma pigmentosum group C-complementing protein